MTVGPLLCPLQEASWYLHLCLYLVPAPKAHNPPDMGSVQTAKRACALQGRTPREQAAEHPWELRRGCWGRRGCRGKKQGAGGLRITKEATDLDK